MSETSPPLRVLSFESRRAAEMQSLIERNGAVATIAPSMREVPLERNEHVFEFGGKLLDGEFDLIVFMTGVGARALVDALQRRWDRASIFSALNRVPIAVRGPKPTAVLREWQVRIDYRAPEPNTWREMLATLQGALDLRGLRIAVQEYGKPSEEFYDALRAAGAAVTPVPIYRWELPEDTRPLRAAVHGIAEGQFDVLLITSAQQIQHALLIAGQEGVEEHWRDAARRMFVASIGPTATEAIREVGLHVDFEPSHPKMGTLVREAIAAARSTRRRS